MNECQKKNKTENKTKGRKRKVKPSEDVIFISHHPNLLTVQWE